MNTTYRNTLEALIQQASPEVLASHEVEFRNFFGAVAGYVDGRIFVSCGKFGVALRLPLETLTELFKEEDVSNLRYFPNGHIKKEYAVLPERILGDQDQFKINVSISIQYAVQL